MEPAFSAVSSSAKQLWQILRCIGFSNKAQVQITEQGVRVTADNAQVMQGVVFLDKALFTTYIATAGVSNSQNSDDEEADVVPFEISLSSLLQTLQIFGINDNFQKDGWGSRNGFQGSSMNNRDVLGMTGVCRLFYGNAGDPLSVVLEEAGVTTTAELTTYEASHLEEIPFQKDSVVSKIIMRATWLHDAVLELESTSPTRVTLVCSPKAPYFTLSSTGPLGSAMLEFSKDPQLLETFQVSQHTSNTYKYSLVKDATRAMSAAVKVSIRTDVQGVLSLQCMIQTEQEGQDDGHTFVDFRFVPYIDEEENESVAGSDSEMAG